MTSLHLMRLAVVLCLRSQMFMGQFYQ